MPSLREIRRKFAVSQMTAYFRALGLTPLAFALFASFQLNRPLCAEDATRPVPPSSYLENIQHKLNVHDIHGAYHEWSAMKSAYPADENICRAHFLIWEAYQNQPSHKSLSEAEVSDMLHSCVDANHDAVLWERGLELFNAKRYQEAQPYFDQIVLSYPSGDYAKQAALYSAKCKKYLKKENF